jgi:small subunit ribosomal protein S6
MATAAKTYEAMFLLPPGAATELEKSIQLVRGIVERHGGKVLVIKKWDERKLAYEMNSQKRGLYIIVFFKAPGAAVTAIERDVNLSEEVIRVLVTHADHLNESEMSAVEPQPIQPREERPSWDRPYTDEGPSRRPGRRDDREPAGAGRDER